MSTNNVVELEKNVRFSSSVLWQAQRDYFDSQGINAWDNQVPFYVTSNPYIAKCYARVVIRYIQEMHRNNKLNLAEPLYLFELGSGSGKFSFYMIKHLFKLQKALRLEDVAIRYVITDFTQSNIDFWSRNKSFAPFVEKGQVDFAIFDVEHDKKFVLQKSGVTLQAAGIKNPTVVIANYVFDTVRHDIFHAEADTIYETLVSTQVEKDNLINGKIKDLNNIDNTFVNKKLTTKYYYQDSVIDSVLMQYKQGLKQSTFLFPIGALKFLQHMRSMITSDLLLLVTDKSYSYLTELDHRRPPSIAFHGSFSMMVNLHAIGEYFKKLGGYARHQDVREGIKTSIFLLGSDINELPETELAIEDYINEFGPADFFNLYQFCKHNEIPPKAIAAEMQMVGWDPYIFSAQVRKILPQVSSMSNALTQHFVEHVPVLEDNFYHMPGESDAFFDLGIFLQSVNLHEQAAEYFKKSLQYYGDHFETLYNLGLCYVNTNRYEDALSYLQKADTMEHSTVKARELMDEIKTRMESNN